MTRFLLLLTLIITPYFVFSQNVSFYFQGDGTPTSNAVWTDTVLRMEIVVYAPAQVDTVTATLENRQVALVTFGGGIYRGNLSLSGLAGDTLTLTVSATDVQNNVGDTAVTFIYRPLNDPGVSLTVDSLTDSSVVRSSLPLNARSPGNTIAVYKSDPPSDQLITTVQDSLPALDLSFYNGQKLTLKLVATDSLGRTATKEITAFVEGSPYLNEYLTVSGKILDFRYNKALVAEKGTGYPVLVDAATGQQSVPLVNFPVKESQAFVTQEGAMFVAGSQSIYEWRNGQIVFQAEGTHLKVSGNYAAWRKQIGVLMRMNRTTGVVDSIAVSGDGGGTVDVSSGGMLVFIVGGRTNTSITKYDSGHVSAVTPVTGGRFDIDPLTDGYNIIYSVRTFSSGESLGFYNGQNQTNLPLTGVVPDVRPYLSYQLANKYSAFVRDGEVIVRDTLGNMQQVTSFNGCPDCVVSVDHLNSKGELMASSGYEGRYFVSSNGQSRRVTAMPQQYSIYTQEIWSRSFYDSTSWYILIGKTLFKVTLDSLPANNISDLQKVARPDSTFHFTGQDFAGHFSGPGELIEVKVTALPAYGTLKYKGLTNISSPIPVSNLGELTYTPTAGFRGQDTIRWIASNGIEYTLDTASVFINITDSTEDVPQPAVSGLSGSYCNAAGIQQIKIVNLPSAGSNVDVTVLLDSTTALLVAADSTFTINPGVLSPGEHHISVTFSYDTIQMNLALTFNITSAVTPSLDISVNVNPITTDSVPVIITATNISGGGKQPLYTFARDRNFSNQLQMESVDNSATVAPTQFSVGSNMVYARVRTSEQCYTSQTGIDSVIVNKTNITAIVDVDNPGQPVTIYPNPFREQVSVNGLQPTKTYIISLYDLQGKLLMHQRVVNKTKTEIRPPAANGAIYILRVYDEKAKKLLGAQKLVSYK